MPAAAGTPTIFEKIAAALGFGAAVGLTPDQITATQAGDARDLTTGEQAIVSLFQPILNSAETEGLADLATFLKAILGALPSVTSVSQAVNVVNGALGAENGPLQQQAVSLGQSALITLVSAALSAVGHVNLPLVG
jgi:hypothetical protein